MATLEELIKQAFREANYTAVGQDPTTAEITEATPRLQNMIASLFGFEIGEQLREWYVPQERAPRVPLRDPFVPTGAVASSSRGWDYPPANVRIVAKVTSDSTIYFPAAPSDGARMALVDVGSTGAITLDGNGRLIEGAASVQDAGEVLLSGATWFYRADLGNWLRLTTPALVDTPQLPAEFDDLLICGLAMRLAARYGVENPGQLIIDRYTDMLKRLKIRYKQSQAMPATEFHAPYPASIETGI